MKTTNSMIDREHLIQVFKINGKPYLLPCEFRKQYYKDHKPVLDQLIKEGLVRKFIETTTVILFEYIGE